MRKIDRVDGDRDRLIDSLAWLSFLVGESSPFQLRCFALAPAFLGGHC